MARGRNNVKIDVQSFQKWFDSLNITRTEFESAVCNQGLVRNTLTRGYMTQLAHKFICNLYKLPEDSFLAKEEEIEVEEEKPIKEISVEDILVVLLSINSKLATLIEALK